MTLDPTKLAGVREAAKLVMDMLTDDTGAFDTYSEQELNAVEKSVERVLSALPGHWIAPDEATGFGPVAEAFRKGAMAALGCEPWEDADDFFSLVGLDYAKGRPVPTTKPRPYAGEGQWLAPDEPTEEMIEAAIEPNTTLTEGHLEVLRVGYARIYRAMRDAAPSSATLTERDKSRDELSALSTQTQGGGEHG